MKCGLADTFLAVLGLHAIKEKPVAVNGKVEIRPVCIIYMLAAGTMLTPSTDDVSCPDLRSPSFGRSGSCYFPCQGMLLAWLAFPRLGANFAGIGQGVHRGPPPDASRLDMIFVRVPFGVGATILFALPSLCLGNSSCRLTLYAKYICNLYVLPVCASDIIVVRSSRGRALLHAMVCINSIGYLVNNLLATLLPW